MYEEIKKILEVEIANCKSCTYLGDGSGSDNIDCFIPICENPKKVGIDNLRSFPFKKEMSCWRPNFFHTNFTDRLGFGTDKEIDDAFKEFHKIVGGFPFLD